MDKNLGFFRIARPVVQLLVKPPKDNAWHLKPPRKQTVKSRQHSWLSADSKGGNGSDSGEKLGVGHCAAQNLVTACTQDRHRNNTENMTFTRTEWERE
jgi:hypothetical protein